MPLEHGQHGSHPFGERSRRPVALQLVVLDEVDAGRREFPYELAEVRR